MRRVLLIVYVNVATVCFLLVALELTGQLAYDLVKGRPVWESRRPRGNDAVELQIARDHPNHHALFSTHPYLVGQLRPGARVSQRGMDITILPKEALARSAGAQLVLTDRPGWLNDYLGRTPG